MRPDLTEFLKLVLGCHSVMVSSQSSNGDIKAGNMTLEEKKFLPVSRALYCS